MKFTILVDLSLVIITLYLSDSCDLKDWPLVKSGKGKQLRENFRLAVKQKLHGPNRSPEKKPNQFQPINTFAQSYYYTCTITLIKRVIN